MIDFGIVKPGTTLYIPFHTFDSNDPSASVTITGLATTDIEVYKDGGTTQRASDAGYALLDTDGIDFDTITGIHGISIDLADNTTAGFYAAGSQYWVVISSITVDAATVSFIAATFRIGYPDAILNTTIATLASQTSFTLTAGPADDDALNGCIALVHDVASGVQIAQGLVSDYTGTSKTVALAGDPGIFTMAVTDNISFFPRVDVSRVGHTVQTAGDLAALITTVDTVVDGIQTDLDNGTDGLGAIKTTADAIETDTQNIQTRLPSALVGGRMDSDVGSMGGVALTSGTSDSGTASTMVDAARTEATTDHWKGLFIMFGSGGSALNVGAVRRITGFTPASDTITFAPDALAAITTETYVILPAELLNVTSLGNIGIDWANVENPTTALDLSGTDIQLVDTTTTNTDMRGTDNAALASVLGALTDAAAAGDPTTADTVMQYVKQLINVLVGTTGVTTMPAAAAPANNVSLAEIIRAIYDDTNELQVDDTPAAIAALNDISVADVNAQVLDVLNTDTFAELAGVPAASSTLADKLTFLFMLARNQVEQTSTAITLRADDTTTQVAQATASDNGTTATKGEYA